MLRIWRLLVMLVRQFLFVPILVGLVEIVVAGLPELAALQGRALDRAERYSRYH